MEKIDNYPITRVPQQARLSFFSVALVHAGMLTALDQFMLGAALGHAMSLSQAYIAILLASLLLGLVTFGLGIAGMREGLSSSLLARWCGFGRVGSLFVSLIIAISLLGWFGVQNAVFAKGLNYALHDKLGFPLAASLSGGLLTVLVAFGFKALRLTARVAVPLFISVIVVISIMILAGHDHQQLLQQAPSGAAMSIPAGITIIIGGCIVASLITPDMSRYSQSSRHVLWMTLITIIVGEFIINGLAILLARALNTADVVTIMSQATAGLGLLVVIFSTLRVNDINLYCSSLSIANSLAALTGIKINYTVITLIIGLLGTALSVAGILDRFIDFLTILGVVFPPIIGVMLVDYFVLKTHRQVLATSRQTGVLPDEAHTPLLGYNAIIACIIGGAIGFWTSWGVPAFNSLIVASVIYGMVEWLSSRTGWLLSRS